MYATGWHNGSSVDEAAGYGLKISERDRDKYFDREWDSVVLDLDGAGDVVVTLSPSFWRSCSELRSADVGKWLLASGVAPWFGSQAPGVVVSHEEDNRFSARILKRKQLPLRN